MKKKVKKRLDWFYQETDRGGQNISECQNIYELVEKLQWRLEDLENEHMHLISKIAKLEVKINNTDYE